MIHLVEEEMRIILLIQFPFHFTMALKDSTFVDGDYRVIRVPWSLPGEWISTLPLA
jgi:hypothetical protein